MDNSVSVIFSLRITAFPNPKSTIESSMVFKTNAILIKPKSEGISNLARTNETIKFLVWLTAIFKKFQALPLSPSFFKTEMSLMLKVFHPTHQNLSIPAKNISCIYFLFCTIQTIIVSIGYNNLRF